MRATFNKIVNLIKQNNNTTSITTLSNNNAINELKNLINDDPNVLKEEDEWENSVVDIALQYKQIDFLEVMLEKDASILKKKYLKNETRVHFAIKQGYMNALKIMLNIDCSLLEQKDGNNQTIVHFAIKNDFVNALEIMLNIDCSLLEQKDGNNQTFLHFAAKCGSLDSIELILKKNPKLLLEKDKHHATPETLAASNNKRVAVNLLQAYRPSPKATANSAHLSQPTLLSNTNDQITEISQLIFCFDAQLSQTQENSRVLKENFQKQIQALLTSSLNNITTLNKNCKDRFFKLYDDYHYWHAHVAYKVDGDVKVALNAVSQIKQANPKYCKELAYFCLYMIADKRLKGENDLDELYKQAKLYCQQADVLNDYYTMVFIGWLSTKETVQFRDKYQRVHANLTTTEQPSMIKEYNTELSLYAQSLEKSKTFLSEYAPFDTMPLKTIAQIFDILKETYDEVQKRKPPDTATFNPTVKIKIFIDYIEQNFINPYKKRGIN